jgi:hypothetical protein
VRRCGGGDRLSRLGIVRGEPFAQRAVQGQRRH